MRADLYTPAMTTWAQLAHDFPFRADLPIEFSAHPDGPSIVTIVADGRMRRFGFRSRSARDRFVHQHKSLGARNA